jgi:hypothetical protein
MSCSWDDRSVLLSNFALTSALSGQLWVVSVADGQRRVLADVKGGRIRKAVFSPDGRFAAYEVWPRDSVSVQTSRIFVVPVDGGDPRLVYESAPWHIGDAFLALMDWTADGRYLILRDVRQGKSALYLLPMKDGVATVQRALFASVNLTMGTQPRPDLWFMKTKVLCHPMWMSPLPQSVQMIAWEMAKSRSEHQRGHQSLAILLPGRNSDRLHSAEMPTQRAEI